MRIPPSVSMTLRTNRHLSLTSFAASGSILYRLANPQSFRKKSWMRCAQNSKTRALTRADITPTRVKAHLKKLRLSKWYEHCHAICNALNGTPAPKLSAALETTLKNMFNEIQKPFDTWVKVVAPQRKNFLSYGYVLYKFCELLGEDDLLQYFSLLKSQDKLYQMDAIWKKICQELHWEYIPSL